MPSGTMIAAAVELPETVKLAFHQSTWREQTPMMKVRAMDASDLSICAIGDLDEMHRWLHANGYEWVTGSGALWTRSVH